MGISDKLEQKSMYQTDREVEYKRNPLLDHIIEELHDLLEPVQQQIDRVKGHLPRYPIGLIVGTPRSGTTLLLQYLASSGFAYPSNLLTRFAYAPYIGILVQKMLFDVKYSHHNDMVSDKPHNRYKSDLGRTKGALSPNEWFHFWRRFMPNTELRYLNTSEMSNIDFNTINKELGLIEEELQKPFVTKGLMQQYNIYEFFQKMPFLFFLYIKRNPIFVMQSIYQSRKKYYGSNEFWWSVKPQEYNELKKMSVYHQIAGQVYFTEKAIQSGLDKIPESNKIQIEYDNFCTDPRNTFDLISSKYKNLGCILESNINKITHFNSSNRVKLDKKELKELEKAYEEVKFLSF